MRMPARRHGLEWRCVHDGRSGAAGAEHALHTSNQQRRRWTTDGRPPAIGWLRVHAARSNTVATWSISFIAELAGGPEISAARR
ncbi:hypothetical protein GXW74_04115 [Roseomonas eburnea]|uniref:Uncharacterized protein n=1 Tax=Neoroseomonas eburnea TaxID=1346889 RepID=A0A9X9X7H1_9PROT|nr:hypothetical protein [Neoroseomonas eburnea]MBR0679657.1 hypothetical protein [Neoroseomonas eburnea]